MHYAVYCRLNLHVLASDREVVRALRRKLKPAARLRDARDTRHALIRGVLDQHHKARDLTRRFALI